MLDFHLGTMDTKLVLSTENAVPQHTILGLSKKVMRNSGLKPFRTLSSNRAQGNQQQGTLFLVLTLFLSFLTLAIGIQITRVSLQKDETW